MLWGLNRKALCGLPHTIWNRADPQWLLFFSWKIISFAVKVWSQIMIFFRLFYFYDLVMFKTGLHCPSAQIWIEPKRLLLLFLTSWTTHMTYICIPFLLRHPFLSISVCILLWYYGFLIIRVCVCVLGERPSFFCFALLKYNWYTKNCTYILNTVSGVLMYWVGQKVCSCFSVASYEKSQMNILANQYTHTHETIYTI